ncbi:MAG TPA: TonB-dependent receptor plug domain-containing protein [Terracidiphilus sp.]|jgi:iron complex outermembrane receptor protein/vitamin B12 transporter
MPISRLHCPNFPRVLLRAFAAALLVFCAAASQAASIRGVITDATGAKVTGAAVSLVSNGQVIASAVSTADGSFQILTGATGRFFLVVSAKSFRQLQTPDFYAGQFDSIERTVVLEPEWARESIVVTATGTPTPQSQTSSATTVLGPLDLALRDDLVSDLRLMPGASVVQLGQLGAQASLFIRGGDSDDNKVLLDGVDAGDLGNQFNFGSLSTTAIESAEVYRGPDSNLFGAGAESGVVSLTTPHGTTSFPSFLFQGSAGSLDTSREQLEVAGAHKKLDYLGAFSWLQTANNLPDDEFHVATSSANLGWALNGTTQIRGTAHYGVSATGVPNAWDFYHVADDATEKDQDLFASASIDNQTTSSFHNTATYGLTRKREQYHDWAPQGVCIPAGTCTGPVTFTGGNYFGLPVTIQGANGFSATGQAILDYSQANGETYPSGSQVVSNRDALVYRGDITITPHLVGLIGFQYEDERGAEPGSTLYQPVERSNYDYLAAVHGDFKNRFFYSLGGSLEHYSLFGVQTEPRAGASYYVFRPHSGAFSGTRVLFDFGESDREPTLPEQDESLYAFVVANGEQSEVQSLHISQIGAPQNRTYEGGVEQSFFSQHLIFRSSYFHNEFGRQIEYVGVDLIPELLPNLTATQQTALETTLQNDFAFELTVNSEAFRAQGIESTIESGIGANLFLRGGYTYLDSVVQRSFTNDDAALLGPIPTWQNVPNGIQIGPYSPLEGARPFRRAPHTGFFTATYAAKKITGVFSAAFASRSDDSTYLEDVDENGGNSLLLPNRNLDYGYAKLDLGGSYQLLNWLDVYAQGENLLDNQHIAPIGYPSLPFTARAGLRIRWAPGSGH